MVNKKSMLAVDASTFSTGFRKPLYDTYGFANIPQTIVSALTGELGGLPSDVLGDMPRQYDKVILLFIDAFGWRFFEKYKDRYPVLQKLMDDGVVSKLTSQFPSTTAAHVTTIHTGTPVGHHGIYEWNYFEPTLDAVIAPLFYSFAGETTRELMKTRGIDPFTLFPHENIHKRLVAKGIPTHTFQPSDFAKSSYGDVIMNGATIHPFLTLAEGLTNVSLQVQTDARGYYYFYFPGIDKIGHAYGPESAQFDAEVDSFLHSLELFIETLRGKTPNTLLLMTADHGQVESDPTHCFYVNTEWPEIVPMLATLSNGRPIIPAGSARDFFLHVKPEYLQTVIETLSSKLVGRAEVYPVSKLINEGFFGPLPLSDAFLSRVGNVIILPYAHQSVWWYEEGLFWQKHTGHHGGLTPEEMETILFAYDL